MTLIQTERRDGVVILTLNDPDRRNILSVPLCRALGEAVAAANTDQDAKAIIVTGTGKAFCAGADLADLEAAAVGRTEAVHAVYTAFMAVADSPLPTLAAVNGPAVGAGLNLALACDMRVASEKAVFDTRFLTLGLHPGGGCTWMLLRAVGWGAASRMLLAGQPVRAEEALSIGLVQAVATESQPFPQNGGSVTSSSEARRVTMGDVQAKEEASLDSPHRPWLAAPATGHFPRAGGRAEPPSALMATAQAQFDSILTVPRELVLRTKATLRLAATQDHQAVFAHETAEQLWSLGEPGFAESIARLKAR